MKYLFITLFTLVVFTQSAKAIEVVRGNDANYIDFSDGTPVNFPLNWDDELERVNIGFSFEFFGTIYTSVQIGANGILVFNDIEPSNMSPGDSIYIMQAYNTDLLDINGSSTISWKNTLDGGKNAFVVQFKNVRFYKEKTSSYANFQVWLYEDGSFKYTYGDSKLLDGAFDPNPGPEVGAGVATYYDNGWDYGFNTIDGVFLSGSMDELLQYPDFNNWVMYAPTDRQVLLWGSNIPNISSNEYTIAPLRKSELLTVNGNKDNISLISLGSTDFGNILGINKYKDKAVGEKHYLGSDVLVKGILFQAQGSKDSKDSINFAVFTIGNDGKPSQRLIEKKIAINCILFDGEINILAFDTTVVVNDSCFIIAEFPTYNPYNDFGFFVSAISNGITINDPYKDQPYRTVTQLFNGEWVDNYTSNFMVERSTSDVNFFLDLDLYFSMSLIFNKDLNSINDITNNEACDPSVGINNTLVIPSFEIYPSPFIEDLNIISSSNVRNGKATIKIVNLEGIEFLSKEVILSNHHFSLPSLKAGIYMLEILSDDAVFQQKIVKQ